MSCSHEQHTTRHPVADLLTPEMRARVRATTFEDDNGLIGEAGNPQRCPLAVALDRQDSDLYSILTALGGLTDPDASNAIWDFIGWADRRGHDPADVYALLGCDADAARQPEDAAPGERP